MSALDGGDWLRYFLLARGLHTALKFFGRSRGHFEREVLGDTHEGLSGSHCLSKMLPRIKIAIFSRSYGLTDDKSENLVVVAMQIASPAV